MKKYIDYFLNYLQTEKDAAKSTIHKYRAVLILKYIVSSSVG